MKAIVEFPDRGVLTEEAAEWLVRLDSDTLPTRQELETLGEWLHRSPAHREELDRLAAFWDRANVMTELAVPLGKRRAEVRDTRHEGARKWTPRLRYAVMGVCIVGAFALGLTWQLRGAFEDRFTSANGLYATAVGQLTTTTLPDGSRILLNTNSQIRVDYGDQHRQVHLLQGEALFTVAKDVDRPFRVYAGSGLIQAVGTAFSVYLKGADVEVMVTEGRVALASVDSSPAGAARPESRATARRDGAAPDITDIEQVESLGTIGAGQVAMIRGPAEDTASVETGALRIVEPLPSSELAERLAWREGVLMFSGDRLEDVLKEVSRYTTVTIEVPDAAIRDLRIGGRFPVGEMEVLLAALETNFNLRVTRFGRNRVVLTAAD